MLLIGPVTIGKRCFVGTRSILRENTVMEDDSALEDLSLLPRGGKIPQRRNLARLARRLPVARRKLPRRNRCRKMAAFSIGMLHAVGLLIFPLLVVSAILPGIIAMNELNYADDYYWYLFLSPFVGLSFVVLLALEIIVVKWLLLGRVKPGRHPLHSLFYFRKWFVDQTMNLSLDILGPLYASVYLPPWYRMLGAKLGKGVELSTASFISPDLLSVDEEGFVADAVSLGATRVRDGFVTVAGNHIGRRSFIGNSAVLPSGHGDWRELPHRLPLRSARRRRRRHARRHFLVGFARHFPAATPAERRVWRGANLQAVAKTPRAARPHRTRPRHSAILVFRRADKPAVFRDGPD